VHKEIKLLPERSLLAACVSGDGNHLVTGSSSRAPRLWDAKKRERSETFDAHAGRQESKHAAGVACVDISPNGNLLVSGGNDFVAKVWDLQGNLVTNLIDHDLVEDEIFGPRTHELQVLGARFSPDSSRVATCAADCLVKLWDAKQGSCLHRLDQPLEAVCRGHAITSVCWVPSCAQVISTSDVWVTLWSAETGQALRTWEAHTNQITSCAHVIEGAYLLTGSRDGTAKLWNLEDGICHRCFKHGGPVLSVAISPDGKHVATGCAGGKTKVWKAASAECEHTLEKNKFSTVMVYFVPL